MSTHRVLIVDDQRDVRRVLRSGLESLGPDFKVTDVPSGEEAMLVASHQPLDLLIADVRLAGMSGLELMQVFRLRNPQLKVILITGLTDQNTRQRVSRAGAEAFFYKPVEMADFLDAVERCLGLVHSILPDQPKDGPAEIPEPVPGLPDRLSGLRQELDAIAAVLLDDRGQIVARAGELPGAAMESSLILSLLTAFSVSAKISHQLGAKFPDNLLCFTGLNYDLYLAHVGNSMSLLLLTSASPESQDGFRGRVANRLRPAVNDLLAVLDHLGVPQQSGEEAATPAVESEIVGEEEAEETPELDLIFRQASRLRLDTQDVDDFWDSLAEQAGDEGVPPAGALSYEQARQLGLAPQDEDLS